MKVVYNWLKDLVDVSATPQELASRLALSGTNIGGVENGPHAAVIEAEVSSNRPDCLGHYGIAREVATIYKLPLKHVSPKPAEVAAKADGAVKVEIQAPELCGRFTARVIRNVNLLFHEKCFDRVRVVRTGRHSPRHALPEIAHRSFHALWPRRRSGNGRAGLPARCGINSAACGRRVARRCRRCLSGQARAEKNPRDARGNSSRDGRGRSRQANGSQSRRSRLRARSNRSNSRRGRLAPRGVGMHATFLARGGRTRNRFDRGDRAHLRPR